jgi:hypothetical protein
VHDQIEEGAEDAGTCELELPPQLPLRLPPCVSDGRQCQEDRSVREVGPADDVLDAIDSTSLSQHVTDRRKGTSNNAGFDA